MRRTNFFCGNEDKKQKKTRNGNKQYFKSDPFVLLPPLIGESKPYKIYLKFTVLKILKKCFSWTSYLKRITPKVFGNYTMQFWAINLNFCICWKNHPNKKNLIFMNRSSNTRNFFYYLKKISIIFWGQRGLVRRKNDMRI